MANNSLNGSSGIRQPVDVICDYHKWIKTNLDSATATVEAIKTTKDFRAVERWYKLCCLSTSNRTYNYYRDLDNYQVFDMNKSVEALQVSVDDHIKKNDSLEKKIQDASKILNDIQTKLQNAHNAACAMENCIKGTIDLEEYQEVKDALTPVLDKAEYLDQKGHDAAEGIAKIAGIQTFSNIDILKDFGKKLGETVKSLKTMVDDNIKKGTDEVKKAQEDLTKVLEALNKLKFDQHRESVVANGLTNTHDFICCTGDGCLPTQTIEEICQSMCDDSVLRTGGDSHSKVEGVDGR